MGKGAGCQPGHKDPGTGCPGQVTVTGDKAGMQVCLGDMSDRDVHLPCCRETGAGIAGRVDDRPAPVSRHQVRAVGDSGNEERDQRYENNVERSLLHVIQKFSPGSPPLSQYMGSRITGI